MRRCSLVSGIILGALRCSVDCDMKLKQFFGLGLVELFHVESIE